MRRFQVLVRSASILVVACLIGLPGCSNLDSRDKPNTTQSTKIDPSRYGLEKFKLDQTTRKTAGKTEHAPLNSDEQNDYKSAESRGRVSMAMGELLEGSEDLAGAQSQYEQALKMDPKSLKAALSLARVYGMLGRPDAALKVYQNAERLHRRSAPVHNDKGLLLADQKDWSGAIESLKMAVKLDPEETKYHNNLGMVLAASGNYEDSWKEFRDAVGPGPAHYNLAVMLLQAGKTAEARNHLDRAVAVVPNLKDARALLAQINDQSSSENPFAATERESEEKLELLQMGQPSVEKAPRTNENPAQARNKNRNHHVKWTLPHIQNPPQKGSPTQTNHAEDGQSDVSVEEEILQVADSERSDQSAPDSSTDAPAVNDNPWTKAWLPPKWLR